MRYHYNMINNKTNTQLNMKNKLMLAGSALAVAAGLNAFIGTSNVSADTVDNTNTYQVKSGDTLWGIALAHNLDLANFEAANGKSEANTLIQVGEVLKLTEATAVTTQEPVQATVTNNTQASTETETAPTVAPTYNEPTSYVQEQATPTYTAPVTTTTNTESTTSYTTAGGDKAASRRQIENGGSYNWDTGNGYYGAYQFAPSTWNAYAQKAGVDMNDHSSAAQDKVADAYAQGAYNGWANTPSQGGW